MDDIEHRRRRLRWWLCVCGNRFPCGPWLYRRDVESRTPRPGGTGGTTLTGWRIRKVER